MRLSQAEGYQSKYLSVQRLRRMNAENRTLEIRAAKIETLKDHSGVESEKAVIYFRDSETGRDVKAGLVLNTTNLRILSNAFNTDESDDWLGNKIRLFTEMKSNGKEGVTVAVMKRSPNAKIESEPEPEPDEFGDDDIPF